MNQSLYQKYASTQNYYYLKDLNAIITKSRTSPAIEHKDIEDYFESQEWLKRKYQIREYPGKIDQLTEYYKYHKDIPRVFMKDHNDIYFEYHD